MTTWAQQTKDTIETQVAAGEITENQAKILLAMADFCTKHDVIPVTGKINLWGFGEADAIFAPADGGKGWWCWLYQLAEPLGMTFAQLLEAFNEDVDEEWEEHRADRLTYPDEDGEMHTLEVVNHSFVLMLLGGKSPWSSTFMDNAMDLFRHAALATGLADEIGGAVMVDDAGNAIQTDHTLGDVIRGEDDLPSEEVARHQAFAGATGPLERGEL